MPPGSDNRPARTNIRRWVNGEYAEDGSVFQAMTNKEQRRFLTWLNRKSGESEEYIRGLVDKST